MECKKVEKTKQCKRCNQILPIDDFEVATRDGFRRRECRTCGRIVEFIKRKPGRTEDDYWKWKNEVKEKEKLFNEGKRKCSCCGEIKLLSEFTSANRSFVFLSIFSKKSFNFVTSKISGGNI